MTTPEPSGINQIWADLLVEELIRAGVGLFCIAPGSRSAPLALAVAAHPRAQCVMHYDERGTAFCALGYGRATRRPAAWITTSGTAVANGMPAVVEASMDAVPMLLVTSDRPPETASYRRQSDHRSGKDFRKLRAVAIRPAHPGSGYRPGGRAHHGGSGRVPGNTNACRPGSSQRDVPRAAGSRPGRSTPRRLSR